LGSADAGVPGDLLFDLTPTGFLRVYLAFDQYKIPGKGMVSRMMYILSSSAFNQLALRPTQATMPAWTHIARITFYASMVARLTRNFGPFGRPPR
jgi:hypothetical protein